MGIVDDLVEEVEQPLLSDTDHVATTVADQRLLLVVEVPNEVVAQAGQLGVQELGVVVDGRPLHGSGCGEEVEVCGRHR